MSKLAELQKTVIEATKQIEKLIEVGDSFLSYITKKDITKEDLVKYLDSVEDINYINKSGKNAIYYACKIENREFVELLLDYDCEIIDCFNLYEVMNFRCEKNKKLILEFYLENIYKNNVNKFIEDIKLFSNMLIDEKMGYDDFDYD